MQNEQARKDQVEDRANQAGKHTGDTPPRLIPLVSWKNFHPWPPIGGLRHLAFHAKARNCEDVFIRCGRKVLIDEKKFFEFIKREDKKAG